VRRTVTLTRGVCLTTPGRRAIGSAAVTTPRAEAASAFVPAGEHEDRVAHRDVLAAAHGLVC